MNEPTTTTTPVSPAAPAAPPAPATLLSGGESPAAPAATIAAGQPATPAAPAVVDGEFGLTPEQRGFFENKVWYKDGKLDVKKLATGYIELEGFRGVPSEDLFRLSKNATPEERARLNERLGVPKEPKGYELKVPEGSNVEALEKIKQAAHKTGMTQAQLSAFFDFSTIEVAAQQEREAAAEDAALKSGLAELSKDWGGALEKNQKVARRAAEIEAFTSEGLDEGFWEHAAKYPGANPAKIARALYKLGVGLGEDKFVTGEPNSGGVRSPESAQARLDEIGANPTLRKALLDGSDPSLARELEQLNAAILAGQRQR